MRDEAVQEKKKRTTFQKDDQRAPFTDQWREKFAKYPEAAREQTR